MIENTPNNFQPDWRDESTYDYTREFTRNAWAWEFLRRNPSYVAQATTSALPTAHVLRRAPLILLLDVTESVKSASAWGLHFFRSAKPRRGFRLRFLARRCESGRSASRCASGCG